MSGNVMTPEVLDVALTLWSGLDCPRALTCTILVRYGEWDQLASLKAVPLHYSQPHDYWAANQATDFLRKFDGLPTSFDLDSITLNKWWWAERECFKTNQRFNEILDFGTHCGVPVDPRILDFIDQVRKNVVYLIGDRPNDEILDGRFGPGATVSDGYGCTTVPHKLSSCPTFTPRAFAYLIPWTGTAWARAHAAWDDVSTVAPRSCRGDVYFTVNKDSTSKRACAKSPSINVFYQLAYGGQMRRRLKRRGIDLDDGQEVHRRVACRSSIDGTSCTVDMTSASDTVALVLGRLCLPTKWLAPLLDLRCTHTLVPPEGEPEGIACWARLEKFSAMGNGFTFELETVIFAAVAQAACPDAIIGHDIYVYGDDLIIPAKSYEAVISALKFFGFTPNPRKCFSEGSFRESCGGDFFDGVPVRAHYLKEEMHEPSDYISLANGLRRTCGENHTFVARWPLVRRAWFRVLDYLPVHIRSLRGPKNLGDLLIHDDESRWNFRLRNSQRWFRVWRPCAFVGTKWGRFCPETQYAAALYGVALKRVKKVNNQQNWLVLGRDAVTGYKVGRVAFS